MSVGDRIDSAIEAMENANAESALLEVSAAIDATATAEYTQGGRSSYKRFLAENMSLVTKVGLGVAIENFNLKLDHPDLETDANGLTGLQDVLYHVVRCSLMHEASLPSNIEFGEQRVLKLHKNHLVLPRELVYGIVIAVVVAPSNHDQKLGDNRIANIGNPGIGILQIPMNCLWGRRSEILWLLESIHHMTVALVEHSVVESGNSDQSQG